MASAETKEVTWTCDRCGSSDTSEDHSMLRPPDGWRIVRVYDSPEAIASAVSNTDLCPKCASMVAAVLVPVAQPAGEQQ